MDIEQIKELFEKHENEYLKFERIENKLSNRADLHAFILLDKLFPDEKDIISYAKHDEITLELEIKQIETLTEEQIIELIRCGVLYDMIEFCLIKHV